MGLVVIEEEEEVVVEVSTSLGTLRNCHRCADGVDQVEEVSNRAMDHLRKCSVSLKCVLRLRQKLTALEMGTFMHATEGEMVCESINPKIPYFNAPIYLENKVRDLDNCL